MNFINKYKYYRIIQIMKNYYQNYKNNKIVFNF